MIVVAGGCGRSSAYPSRPITMVVPWAAGGGTDAVARGMLEQHFVTSRIKAWGNSVAFFDRPIAAFLGVATILVWLSPLVMRGLRARAFIGRRFGPAHNPRPRRAEL